MWPTTKKKRMAKVIAVMKDGSSNKSDDQKNSIINQHEFVATFIGRTKHPSQNYKKERQCLYRLLDGYALLCQLLIKLRNKLFFGEYPSRRVYQRWIWDIEGIISDKCLISPITEYFVETCIFFKKYRSAKNQSFEEDLQKGIEFVYESIPQVKCLSADGSKNLLQELTER